MNFWCIFSVYQTTCKELHGLYLELNERIRNHVGVTELLEHMTEVTFRKKELIEQMRVTLRENLATVM